LIIKLFLHQYYFDNETKAFEPEATFWRIVDIPVDPSVAKNMTIRRSINRPEGCQTCQDFTPGIDLKILWGTGNNFEGQANFQQNFIKQGSKTVALVPAITTTTATTTTTTITTTTKHEDTIIIEEDDSGSGNYRDRDTSKAEKLTQNIFLIFVPTVSMLLILKV